MEVLEPTQKEVTWKACKERHGQIASFGGSIGDADKRSDVL